MTARDDISAKLEKAVEGLAEEARRQLEVHPWGHLVSGRRELLKIRLALPLGGRREDLERAAREAGEAVSESLKALIHHRAIFRPGRVFCLRCASTECPHAAPTEARHVFTGYGPTGLPRFVDLGQWLLEQKDPRVTDLYQTPAALLTRQADGQQLSGQLLPAYRQAESGFRLHGEVVAGWYRLKDPAGDPHNLAVSFLLISTQGRRSARRFGINVVGLGPYGESLESLFERLGRPPWSEALRWAREALETVEVGAPGKGRRQPPKGKRLEERLQGILAGLARRLEKGRRARDRRTQHAQERHDSRARPTDMAMADLRRAASEEILFDIQKETLVVLGERGRTHFFNLEGKHVTSVRYNPPTIERRREKGAWRPASAEERLHLAGLSPAAPREIL
ncbi:MAG: hypothetical protein KDD47_13920 [Acidobacteria bacterium]|nr:hypothetical protein [Acidobacteriota bacterium]